MINGIVHKRFLWLPGIFFFVYIVVRAIAVPVTHDESNTILTYAAYSVADIMLYTDPVPNNHIVNTLLIKLFVAIFGLESFVVRLPNVLGFFLYYFFLLRLVRLFAPNLLSAFIAIVLLTCNPFFIEFFSLARGYALACAMLMASVFYTYQYLSDGKDKFLLSAMVWAAIGVYTNFTLLNFYVALSGLLSIAVVVKKHEAGVGVSWMQYLNRLFKIIFLVTVVLAAFIIIPIIRMVETAQFIHWGHRNFYDDTLLTLTSASFYGESFLQLEAVQWCFLFVLAFTILTVVAFLRIIKNRMAFISDPFVFFQFLALSTVFVNIAQFYIAGTPYLTSRTALFFIPVFALPFAFICADVAQKKILLFWPFIIASCIAIGVFAKNMNTKRTLEWWYDADTKTILHLLEQYHIATQQPVSLNTNWLFFPSFNFHIQARDIQWIQLTSFHKDIQTGSETKFYYTTIDEALVLDRNYRLYSSFGWQTRQLLIRRQEPLLIE